MIKKFHAASTRDALRQVRDALGANAIILSNRQVAGGVEIIAVADLDMANLAAQAEPAGPVLTARQAPPQQMTLDEPRPQVTTLTDYLKDREASLIRPSPARKPPEARPAPLMPDASPLTPRHSPPTPPVQPAVDELANEIRLLRGLVEGQLAGFAWNDLTRRAPLRAETMKRLLAAGFSSAFARQLLDKLPQGEADLQRALKWVKSAIGRNLRVAIGDDIIEKGGAYAIVGPTGVGKTTTVAKLAARAVLRFGANKVALITTDTYRIGAQDQLRIYGRILGTPVFAVRDESDLDLTLADLSDRHLVLIDTVGMSQRDQRVAEQVALLCGGQDGEVRSVKRLLLLGAPAQGMTLEEVARAYAGPGLIGCIITKIDEALTFGPVLDIAIRHELPLHYVTNGQRVPEDLHLANSAYLTDRAFRLNQAESPYKQEESDYPILMAAAQETAQALDAADLAGAHSAAG